MFEDELALNRNANGHTGSSTEKNHIDSPALHEFEENSSDDVEKTVEVRDATIASDQLEPTVTSKTWLVCIVSIDA